MHLSHVGSERLPELARPREERSPMSDDGTPPGRVVVTGGAGFVGSWTCERLLDEGAEVVCVDNFLTGSPATVTHLQDEDGFTLLAQDICNGLSVDGSVDWVLHLASPASPIHYLSHPIETMRVGSAGTLNALDLAGEKEARFVLASTSEVYGDPLEHPQRESYWGNVNPIGPRSVYDESKRYAEALTMAYRRQGMADTAIVRIFNTYGPRMRLDDGRAIPAFMSQALAGAPLTVTGDGSQTRSLCYVQDTVDGILALAASDHSGPMNIGGPEEITMLELAERVRELAGSSSPIKHVDLPEDDPRVRRPDTTLAETTLGWQPRVSLDEGLKRTLEWFAAQTTS
jgi:dTDP-glucose 4,6-dehydratase